MSKLLKEIADMLGINQEEGDEDSVNITHLSSGDLSEEMKNVLLEMLFQKVDWSKTSEEQRKEIFVDFVRAQQKSLIVATINAAIDLARRADVLDIPRLSPVDLVLNTTSSVLTAMLAQNMFANAQDDLHKVTDKLCDDFSACLLGVLQFRIDGYKEATDHPETDKLKQYKDYYFTFPVKAGFEEVPSSMIFEEEELYKYNKQQEGEDQEGEEVTEEDFIRNAVNKMSAEEQQVMGDFSGTNDNNDPDPAA